MSEILSAGYTFLAARDRFTAEQLRRLLRERCLPEHAAANRLRFRCFVAEAEGSIAGFIAIGDGCIEELWVRPAQHRRGVGSTLFRIAEGLAREAGRPTLRVETTGYGVPFYEAMGMRIIGRQAVTFGPLERRQLIVLEKPLRG